MFQTELVNGSENKLTISAQRIPRNHSKTNEHALRCHHAMDAFADFSTRKYVINFNHQIICRLRCFSWTCKKFNSIRVCIIDLTYPKRELSNQRCRRLSGESAHIFIRLGTRLCVRKLSDT
jgi:hypothetical protein